MINQYSNNTFLLIESSLKSLDWGGLGSLLDSSAEEEVEEYIWPFGNVLCDSTVHVLLICAIKASIAAFFIAESEK